MTFVSLIIRHLRVMKKNINIAIFASGNGSNAENITNHFSKNDHIKPTCILCNNDKAFVLERAKKLNLDTLVFNRQDFKDGSKILKFLEEKETDIIVLAGFLWLIPEYLTEKYNGRILNIHPALLPKFGGKGMYGMNVHQAVWENKETESGITIHAIDQNYDKGETIFQAKVAISATDTPETIAEKVHALEYKHFPTVIENFAEDILNGKR